MAERLDLDEAIFRQPPAPLNHVIEHHRDLREWSTDTHKPEEQEIQKGFTP